MTEPRHKRHKSKDKSKKLGDSIHNTTTSKTEASLTLPAGSLNVTLSSLFAVKQPPIKAKINAEPQQKYNRGHTEDNEAIDSEDDINEDDHDDGTGDNDNSDDQDILEDESDDKRSVQAIAKKDDLVTDDDIETTRKRKRKRKDADEDLEATYMDRLARTAEKEVAKLAAERSAKKQRIEKEARENKRDGGSEGELDGPDAQQPLNEDDTSNDEGELEDEDEDVDLMSPPPKHETEQQTEEELAKARRTVFLGNVSTAAITSKASRKTLLNHLASFFDTVKAADGESKAAVESLRFRSTPYATAIPKKAAFAKRELMDATTRSTNAYAVYSSPALAREAAKRLNGSVVLGRHLRVDEVAHPAKVDHRRCVFVGNLGFVDDESNIQEANEEEGREKRKRGKEPADVEEGLWQTFGKCGQVESVRVIRDSKTRVGKGIAYVQFTDANSVEAALLLNEKKFPPMLPRKLRVSRAKAPKRNAKPGSDRPTAAGPNRTGYQRKITQEETSQLGRAGKLLGRAGAASQARATKHHQNSHPRPPQTGRRPAFADGIKKPENFIFEGHRASAKQGKSGLKLGGKHGKKKTTARVTKRSQAFKVNSRKKPT